MEYTQYVVTTFGKSLTKIIPILVTIVLGYFIFVKVPFFMFLRTMKKAKEQAPIPDQTIKLDEARKAKVEKLRVSGPPPKQEKKQETKQEQKQEEKREEKKSPPKKDPPPRASDEAVFNFTPGEKFTKEELKKRYHQLLKMNHPDKVAMLDPDFKKLADKKTKELNDAYEKLKAKAS